MNPENDHTICLLGYFNAHTSNAEDFIYVNEHICDTFNIDDVKSQVLNKNLLEDLSITTARHRADKSKTDNYEPRLLSFLFVCIVILRPKPTAMVMAGLSVRLTTLFSWPSLNKRLTGTSCTYFRL